MCRSMVSSMGGLVSLASVCSTPIPAEAFLGLTVKRLRRTESAASMHSMYNLGP